MKYLFLACFLALVGASYATYTWQPDAQTDKPVIYWVTDANPARREQVRLFGEWLAKNNYPEIELRLDMANSDRTKKIIQGVSGVAGDVQDQGGGADMRYFRAIGLNTDVTDAARRLGFGLDKTYPVLETELAIEQDGELRQYQFPCNVNAHLLFVNRDTLRQHGQPLPPMRWTVEEFERLGKQFVEAANRGLPRRTVFYADQLDPSVLRNSYGGSRFNETATRCTTDSEATRLAWSKIYQWTYQDRILPNAADKASFTVESGYGGQSAQLFTSEDAARGQYAMMWTGRYLLIEFRKYDAVRKARGQAPIDYGVSEPPHAGFPNTGVGTRAAMVYAGGKHKDLAEYFLAFLASAEYNMQIVKDGDALPPNPAFTKSEEYLRPAEYPNEWDVHGPFAVAALDIAIGTQYSPFILQATADRYENDERDKYMNHLKSVEDAARDAAAVINAEIDLTLRENPSLREEYDRLAQNQAKIDALKARLDGLEAANEPIPDDAKIPLDLIENPFHRTYYQAKGWVK
jgi:multiple sugar transport system substrate-binding protein